MRTTPFLFVLALAACNQPIMSGSTTGLNGSGGPGDAGSDAPSDPFDDNWDDPPAADPRDGEPQVDGDWVYAPELLLIEDDPCFDEAVPSDDRQWLEIDFSCDPGDDYILPGHLLVGVDGGGYLVRVEEAQWTGLTLLAEVEPARLTDAIWEGAWDEDFEFTFTDEREGLDYSGQSWPIPGAGSGSAVTLNTATIDVQPEVKADGRVSGLSLDHLQLIMGLTVTVELEVEVKLAESASWEGSKQLGQISRPFYFQAGWVPVTGRIEIPLKARAAASAEGEITLTFGFDAQATGGFHANWTASNGADLDAGWGWTGGAKPVTVDAGATLTAEAALGIEPSVQLYGMAGPALSLEAYVKGEASLDCPNVSYAIKGGVSAQGSFSWDVWGYAGSASMDPWTYERDLISGEHTIDNETLQEVCEDEGGEGEGDSSSSSSTET
jgi:hypothetical protein